MSEQKLTTDDQVERGAERAFELERLVFFSDAVFAIAITLLALELHVPNIGTGYEPGASATLMQAVFANFPSFLAFTLSFYIIGAFWVAHHRYFRYIQRYNDRLLRINLVLLFFVVLTPYTTSVMGEYCNLQFAIIVYAINLMAVGLSTAWIWRYSAQHDHLVAADLDPLLIKRFQVRAFSTPLVALVVIFLTFVVGNRLCQLWLVSHCCYPPAR